MTKIHYIVIILGSGLFIAGLSYGVGWLIGWLFMVLLRLNREKILDRIIDFKNFSVGRYVAYLFGVTVWVALPLIVSFIIPEYVDPLAIFGAYFADRILMFITNYFG
jgi:hypothetical protein